jgi:hypothetical protein
MKVLILFLVLITAGYAEEDKPEHDSTTCETCNLQTDDPYEQSKIAMHKDSERFTAWNNEFHKDFQASVLWSYGVLLAIILIVPNVIFRNMCRGPNSPPSRFEIITFKCDGYLFKLGRLIKKLPSIFKVKKEL